MLFLYYRLSSILDLMSYLS
uniref:Uncharacterized protein n=1 Tax=Arundo donax TaxID=35708 RepID=A0A0A9EVU8_ARUDO